MNYISSLRLKHWVKNFFVFIPILVSGLFIEASLLRESFYAFMAFCFGSSFVYIFNDLLDREKDRNHPVKKFRAIASGEVSTFMAIVILILLSVLIWLTQNIAINNFISIILAYIFLNINYSLWMKNIPVLDVLSISLGFVLRVQAGVVATDLSTSPWLIAMTFCLSMLLALGKRKAELQNSSPQSSRSSLSGYNETIITSMQSVFTSSTLIFYFMYANLTEKFLGNKILLQISTLFVVAGLMRYIQIAFDEDMIEEPTNILLKDKFILISVTFWSISIILSFII